MSIELRVGSSIEMTKQGEVTWSCISATKEGVIIAHPDHTSSAAVKVLRDWHEPDYAENEIDRGGEAVVYTLADLAIKAYHGKYGSPPTDGGLPDLRVAIAIHHGFEQTKAQIKRWRLHGAQILAAYLPHSLLVEAPNVRIDEPPQRPVWIMEKITSIDTPANHSLPAWQDISSRLRSVEESYSMHTIARDINHRNLLITRMPAFRRLGNATLIDGKAIALMPGDTK